jgi:nicotinamidase-related amidase
LEKTAFSCCNAEGFDAAACADQRTQWILCGMEAHVCVLQTALELRARGLEVFVVADAISSRTEANRDNALARLRQAGVIVSNTESVLFEWLRDASDPQFKVLSALIR